MKTKEKEEVTNKANTQKQSNLQLLEKGANKEESNSNEELIQRDEVTNTPFIMITVNGETFGTFGKYRITESYYTKKQCEAELKKVDWNRIIQITSLINEMLNTKK